MNRLTKRTQKGAALKLDNPRTERKHGEWEIELDEYEDEANMICSSCRALHIFETVEEAKRRAKEYSFCPNCGAIMDGKEK